MTTEKLQNCMRITNLILGYFTIIFGILILVGFVLGVVGGTLKFSLYLIPTMTLPFFFSLFGIMVLSNIYDYPAIKENCQFLNHSIGQIVFYVYLAALMGYLQAGFASQWFFQIAIIGACVAYACMAVLIGLKGCFGEDAVANKIDSIEAKITKE